MARKVIRPKKIIICGQCALNYGKARQQDTPWHKTSLRWHVAMNLPNVLVDVVRATADQSVFDAAACFAFACGRNHG